MNRSILSLLSITMLLTASTNIVTCQTDYEALMIKFAQLKDQKDNHDEKLLEDLLHIAESCYQKIIKTTALYFTGVLMNSERFHQEIIFEISKHGLQAGQLIAQYLPKLLQNPKISWQVKAKRCAYILSFLIITIVWMKEMYQPTSAPSVMRSCGAGDEITTFHENIQPRQRPSLA